MKIEGEHSPEKREASMRAFELAGALQGIKNNISFRDFRLDLHQENAIDAIGQGIVSGETEGYLDSATGSGKALLIALLTEAAVRAGQRVHILAPTITIADQLLGSDRETGVGRFTDLLDEGVVKQNYGGRTARHRHQAVISTYQGFVSEAKAIEEGRGRLGQFDLILGDECHMSLGTETSRALYRYMPDAIKIGFSATPDYAEDRRSEEIYGRPWFEFSLRSAIETGVAAPVRPLLFETESSVETIDYQADFTERELAPLINNMERNGSALRLAQDFVADGRQGIIACIPGGGNAHATIMSRLLSEMSVGDRKIIAKDIGVHLSKDEVRQRLQAYDRGEIDILTFTRALEMGWDSECASFCINLAPTTSPVRTTQLLGRIVRPNPDGRESIFVDFIDENIGIAKQQYTAYHALDIDEIDIDRVLGWGYQGASDTVQRSAQLSLRPELIERVMRMQGRLLREAIISKSKGAVDPIVAHWERRLAKEGMPAELPNNITFTPRLSLQYQRAAHRLERQNGIPPSSDEVADHLEGKISKEQQRLIREFGQRSVIPMEELEKWHNNREPVEDVIVRLAIKDGIQKALNTISEREAGIISLRFGLGTERGEERTNKEIGDVYGIGGTRVAQIASKSLAKLRHINRSDKLRGFVSDESERIPTWMDVKSRELETLRRESQQVYRKKLHIERTAAAEELSALKSLREDAARQSYPVEAQVSAAAYIDTLEKRAADLAIYKLMLQRRIDGAI